MVSLRQAELFSTDTYFDGFISFNGGLNGDMPGWVEQRSRSSFLNKVNKTEEIKKITKPILLLHTTTDSNVNIELTNKWARKAQPIMNSNKIPLDILYVNNVNPGEEEGDGHYIPKRGLPLNQYVEKVCDFIAHAPQNLKNLDAQIDLITYQQKYLSNKLLRDASVEEVFLSEAFKSYTNNSGILSLKNFEDAWENHYEPLWKVAYLFETFIRQKDHEYLKEKGLSENTYYTCENKPGRLALESCLRSIRETAYSGEAVKKTILANSPLYLSLIKGDHTNCVDENWIEQALEKLVITPRVSSAFWHIMTYESGISYRARYLLAFSYFNQNPHLLEKVEPYTDKFWWTLKNEYLRQTVASIIERQQTEESEATQQAKAHLKKVIEKYELKKSKGRN